MTQRDSRRQWIDAVRGIAIVLVVFYHSVIALPVAGAVAPLWLERLNNSVAPFRMPILMFLSGLLLARSLAKPPREYVIGKVRSIAWPYLVWTTITLAFLYLGSNSLGEGGFTVERVVLLVVDPRTYTWYLAYLFVYYLIALALPALARDVAIPMLLIACAIASDGDGWSRATYLLAFFFLGDLVTRLRTMFDPFRSPWFTLLCATVAGSTMALAAWGVPMRYAVWSVPGTVAMIAALIGSSGWIVRHLPLTVRIGRQSIVYYVTHWPVVAATAHVLNRIGVTSGVAATVIMMVAGLTVSALMVWERRRFSIIALLYSWPARKDHRTAKSD